MRSGKLIIFSAPSGSGKTTLVQRMLAIFPELAFSVSATSRTPRENELDGKDYYFFTSNKFAEKINNGEFLEWEEVYQGIFYGTLKSEVERLWHLNKHVVFDMDVAGGLQLKKKYGDRAICIFIAVPDLSALEERLKLRGTESPEKIKIRLQKAEKETQASKFFDHIVMNDHIDKAEAACVDLLKTFLKS